MSSSNLVKTLYADFFKSFRKSPDKIFIFVDKKEFSYKDIYELAKKISSLVAIKKLKKLSYVCIDVKDPALHVASILSLNSLNLVSIIIPNDTTRVKLDAVNIAQPALIICDSYNFKESIHPSLVVLFDKLESLVINSSLNECFEVVPESPSMVYFTSGTSSGIRKGVVQSAGNLFYSSRYISNFMQLDSSCIEFIASPYDNAFWFGRIRTILMNSGSVILNSGSVNPLKIYDGVVNLGANSISGDSSIFIIIIKYLSDRLEGYNKNIKWIKIASQPLTNKNKNNIRKLFCNAKITFNYGLTEAMRCCLLDLNCSHEKLSSVGRPCDGVDVKIFDDNYKLQPPGVIGDVYVNGSNLALTYINNDDLWLSKIRNNMYSTADMGYIDEDGYLYILGRSDHAINVGGRKVSENEVFNILQEFLPNYTYCIIGMTFADSVNGQDVCCVIESSSFDFPNFGNIRHELLSKSNKHLVPSCFYVVETIPKTSNGKVLNNELVSLLTSLSPIFSTLK
jgi:long-chain acyl-CoA synthetase